MKSMPTWGEYFKQKETSAPQVDETPLKRPSIQAEAKAEKVDQPENTGEALDKNYRDPDFDRKLQEFIKGKKNAQPPVVPPKEAPKGWFVVDEETKGFWCEDAWTNDPAMAQAALINSAEEAKEIASLTGGVAIPANEILG